MREKELKPQEDIYITKIYCDMCGSMIADGTIDSWYGPNFWGIYTKLDKETINEIKVTHDKFMYTETLKFVIGRAITHKGEWEICYKCADVLKKFIEDYSKVND